MAKNHIWGTPITYNGSLMAHNLGIIRTEFDTTFNCWKSYKFIATGATFLVSGDACGFVAGGTTIITGSDADQNIPAGIATNRIDSNSYGWIQCAGYNSSVRFMQSDDGGSGDSGVGEGDTLVLGAGGAACSTVRLATASTYKPMGFLFGPGSSQVYLTCNDTSQI